MDLPIPLARRAEVTAENTRHLYMSLPTACFAGLRHTEEGYVAGCLRMFRSKCELAHREGTNGMWDTNNA